MERRTFLSFAALFGGGMLVSACGGDGNNTAVTTTTTADTALAATQAKPTGAVTMYYEIRVPNPEKATVLAKIDALIGLMKAKTGYLSLSFKQMTGESTMVKNYPNSMKGALDQGFVGNSKVPNFYSLFVRFDNYDNMLASGVQQWFVDNIQPSLFAYNGATTPPTKTSVVLEHYEGVYVTVAAGDRTAIYTTPEAIETFLKNQSDEVNNLYVTVENHVMINNVYLAEFNTKVRTLLTTAQTTFQPSDDPAGLGLAGAADNTYYRKAVTTEILQNAFYDGNLRSYIMHGVWESMYDHENSHIDTRFQQASGPVGAYVVVGPVEPFYNTIKQG
ncbi:hypothetical protein [Thiothrix winogradskyi]|uniref:Lipoprotein n=1 Tax=Thiothrix winogradskyi TaxID=96472 RepID=A0ABY3T3G3_9GAMM|nr:hypothetical protein [Thiothrix winogradskyi]UJS26387.1 hypothetical protein L2Y54_10195 [Thiothrix winogradskyi]